MSSVKGPGKQALVRKAAPHPPAAWLSEVDASVRPTGRTVGRTLFAVSPGSTEGKRRPKVIGQRHCRFRLSWGVVLLDTYRGVAMGCGSLVQWVDEEGYTPPTKDGSPAHAVDSLLDSQCGVGAVRPARRRDRTRRTGRLQSANGV